MNGLELAKQGLCEICHRPTYHGPWSDDEIAEAIKDTGEPEFGDHCDTCLVRELGKGDAKYTARLLGRPVQLSLGAAFAALLGGGNA